MMSLLKYLIILVLLILVIQLKKLSITKKFNKIENKITADLDQCIAQIYIDK